MHRERFDIVSLLLDVIPGIDQSFSREVDDEANSYFQRLYVQSMSVDEVLEILKRLKDSQNSQERVSVDRTGVFYPPLHRAPPFLLGRFHVHVEESVRRAQVLSQLSRQGVADNRVSVWRSHSTRTRDVRIRGSFFLGEKFCRCLAI